MPVAADQQQAPPSPLDAYLSMKGQLSAAVVAMVAAAWAQLAAWRDADITGFAATAAQIVGAGQSQMGALTSGYLAQVTATSPLAVAPATGAALRAGVAPGVVYRRPGVQVWTALSKGASLDSAVAQGAWRAATLASTDMQLAATHAAQQVLTVTPHVVGYRRVITNSKACALCVIASTQRYHVADLMPIHPNCDCAVAPIIGDRDPGRVLDQATLDAAHAEIQARLGTDSNDPAVLRKQIIVHHHGELGPVLGVRGQHFAGPAEVAAAA